MATIAPFKGILFAPEKVKDIAKVLTPPYDVISPEEQEAFYQAHPNSVIRLILGKTTPEDNEGNNPHSRAAKHYQDWQAEGVLIRDTEPCFYLLATEFEALGQKHERLGLVAAVRLEPFSTGAVLPHEQTYSKVKSERLALFKKVHANFSSIFSLFPDSDGGAFARMAQVIKTQSPDVDVTDHAGCRQRMWRITDPETQAYLSQKVGEESVYIADGHHRYETSLAFMEWLEAENPGIPQDHPARSVMMYLSSMADPGMIILAAHRMLARMDAKAKAAFLEKAPEYFDITEFDASTAQEAFLAALEAQTERTAVGVALTGDPLRLMVIKPEAMNKVFEGKIAPELRDLDVTVLRGLIFLKLLGLTETDMDDATLISYDTKHRDVLAKVAKGEVVAGFILNATKIQHVRAVAKAGLTMPRKSTYFYPKVITGMVMKSLKAEK
ncbi:MAG: DUF1015 domain-containing protein [Desulfatibacillum sp.]|nr:DUF1015 domain-containing protein [Desulfatibacillum sp.]